MLLAEYFGSADGVHQGFVWCLVNWDRGHEFNRKVSHIRRTGSNAVRKTWVIVGATFTEKGLALLCISKALGRKSHTVGMEFWLRAPLCAARDQRPVIPRGFAHTNQQAAVIFYKDTCLQPHNVRNTETERYTPTHTHRETEETDKNKPLHVSSFRNFACDEEHPPYLSLSLSLFVCVISFVHVSPSPLSFISLLPVFLSRCLLASLPVSLLPVHADSTHVTDITFVWLYHKAYHIFGRHS